MNRKQRRAMKKAGNPVKKEPAYMVKPSEYVRSAIKGPVEKAMNREINAQILEKDKGFTLDMDTMVLWALRQYAGWGPKKLKEFYLFMFAEHMRMRKFYEMDETYPERHKLKEMGVDVTAMYNQLFDDKGNFKNPEEVVL